MRGEAFIPWLRSSPRGRPRPLPLYQTGSRTGAKIYLDKSRPSVIRERALLASVPNSLHPGWCVVVWIITSAYSTASFRLFLRGAQTPIWVDIAVSAVEGALIAWGQSALNSTWRASTPGSARERVHPVEWAVIGVGAILVGLALLSDLI